MHGRCGACTTTRRVHLERLGGPGLPEFIQVFLCGNHIRQARRGHVTMERRRPGIAWGIVGVDHRAVERGEHETACARAAQKYAAATTDTKIEE